MSEGVSQDQQPPAEGGIQLTEESQKLAELARNGLPPAADPMAPKLSDTPRPDYIPEKFWDKVEGKPRLEEMAKSYSELEKLRGASAEEKPAEQADDEGKPKEEEKPSEEDPPVEEKPADQPALAAAIKTAQDVYAETGDLDADTRKKLVEAGIGETQIDTYLQGVKAMEKALEEAAHKAAGSADDYKAAVDWAAENWTKDEIKAFNAAIGNPKIISMTVKGLMASFREAEPSEGRLTNIQTGITHGDVYTDMREFHADLAAADKTRDGLARSKAVEKLTRSRKAGTVKSDRRQPFGN